jgi:hypothetical protein
MQFASPPDRFCCLIEYLFIKFRCPRDLLPQAANQIKYRYRDYQAFD